VIARGGLRFEGTADGGVTIAVGHNATENAEVIRTVTLDRESWSRLVAEVSPPPGRPPVVLPAAPAPQRRGFFARLTGDGVLAALAEAGRPWRR
jgi:hypothetical protein